jgi:predicted ribonuclease YlaK
MATQKQRQTPKAKRKSYDELATVMAANTISFDFEFIERRFKFTDKQHQLIDLINNERTKIVLLEGPAGTSKSLLAVYCGLLQMKRHKIDTIMYLRSVVESAQKSMGFLPGTSDEKMSFFTQIVDDKLSELIAAKDIPALHASKKIETMPLNYIRGCSWRRTFVIADEIQNYTEKEILSTLTRIGEGSVMVLCGDRMQSDIRNSGFATVYDLFDDPESTSKGIVTFKFTEEDIVRSEIVKYVVKKFKTLKHAEPALPQNGFRSLNGIVKPAPWTALPFEDSWTPCNTDIDKQ